MGLIIDSTVLIARERRRLDAAKFFGDHPDEEMYLAAITASELLHGVFRADTAKRRKAREEFVEDILARIETIDFDLAIARRHAELWAGLERAGEPIGAYDMLIAATALHYDHAVATLNAAEFRRVRGLRVVDASSYVA